MYNSFDLLSNTVKEKALEIKPLFSNIINCYISNCSTNEDIQEYEKRLLEKCIDDTDNIFLGKSTPYEPPNFTNNM